MTYDYPILASVLILIETFVLSHNKAQLPLGARWAERDSFLSHNFECHDASRGIEAHPL